MCLEEKVDLRGEELVNGILIAGLKLPEGREFSDSSISVRSPLPHKAAGIALTMHLQRISEGV